MTDFILSGARMAGHHGPVDIGVAQGHIAAIAPSLPGEARVEAKGGWVFPGYVDAHIHLDKAHILERCDMTQGGLAHAVEETTRAKAAFTTEDVYTRASLVVDAAVSHGTTALRTFVEVDPRVGLRGLDALLALRDARRDQITIQICAFAQEGITNEPETLTLLTRAMEMGADLVGGCPYRDPDPVAHIAHIFDLARRFDCDADFHIDFDLDPANSDLPALIAATEARGWGRRVVAGHASKLSAMAPADVADMAARLRDAGIGVVALPATDLFLMGRDADRLQPRGVAPLSAMAQAGVRCAVASNNILNPFTPYGDANLARMANLFANVAHLSTDDDLRACFDMVADGAAAMIGLPHSLEVGGPATMVLLDAPDPAMAVRTIAPARAGWVRGRQNFERPAVRLHAPQPPR
ncbi:amidohydrolase family protein [Roseicyclus mahoneyensis]|uniref:Cytosine deaminase n=1 Tax=Roseicyclus mahoneyensis TaxID=164332 RepID=A0A316GNY7_9RHOB|nr:amidohydrolase family protein [Roseicyclus mahoneyensis]PWK62378.1 cytosine deaminase [Roseicyclus mahoneyensis]